MHALQWHLSYLKNLLTPKYLTKTIVNISLCILVISAGDSYIAAYV